MAKLLDNHKSFAIETTLSGKLHNLKNRELEILNENLYNDFIRDFSL